MRPLSHGRLFGTGRLHLGAVMSAPQLTVGDRVVMSKELPGRHDRSDHVGTIEAWDGDEVLVRWSGPDAPEGLARFSIRRRSNAGTAEGCTGGCTPGKILTIGR